MTRSTAIKPITTIQAEFRSGKEGKYFTQPDGANDMYSIYRVSGVELSPPTSCHLHLLTIVMKLLGLFRGVGPTRKNKVDTGHNDEEINHRRCPNKTFIARKGPPIETFLPV